MQFDAVVLAGGKGSRMGRLGERYAKCLLPVGDRPVIAHHLRMLASLGVRQAWVVVGHRADDVRATVGDGRAFGLHVDYVDQGPPLGSGHALGRVRSLVRGPVLIVLGDYFFVPRAPQRFMERLHAGSSAIAVLHEPRRELLSAACVVQVDEHSRVRSIVEKPIVPNGDLKGCGFYAVQPEFFDALARTPRTALRDEYEITTALELFVASGAPVYAEPVIARDANLTVPTDVLECNLEWLAASGAESLIADDALLDVNMDVADTVVGSGARVEGVRGLHRVVVFPGTHHVGSGYVAGTLLTSAGAFPCDSHDRPVIRSAPTLADARERVAEPPRALSASRSPPTPSFAAPPARSPRSPHHPNRG